MENIKKEDEIIKILLKNPELVCNLSLEKLNKAIDILSRQNEEYERKIEIIEKDIKEKKKLLA